SRKPSAGRRVIEQPRSAAGFALASAPRAGRNPEGRLNLISTSASPAYKTFARSFRDSTQKLPRAVRPNQNRYGIRPICGGTPFASSNEGGRCYDAGHGRRGDAGTP